MRQIRVFLLIVLSAVFYFGTASADESALDKAVLAGDWQSVHDEVADSPVGQDVIYDFLKEVSCLALDLDCAPSFYETSPPKGLEGKTIEKWIKSLRRNHKRNAFLSYLMANSYSRSGYHKKSLKELKKAIRQDGNISILFLARSRTYAIMNEMENSLKDANKAVRLDPDNSMAYTLRGSIFDSQGKFQEALKSYAQAIKLKPERAGNYYNRGNSYRHMNQNSEAISDYSHAIILDSTLIGAYFNRANAYFDEAEYEKALTDYRQFVAVADDQFRRMLPRARSQIRTIERIITNDPLDEADRFVDLGYMSFGQNDFDGAITQLKKAIALDSTKSNAYYWRAFAYWRLGNNKEAIDDFTKAIQYHSNDTTAFFNRGALFVETDRLHEAIRDFSSAIELNRVYVLAYENRAKAYESLGHNDSAITDYKSLLNIIPASDKNRRDEINDLIESLANSNREYDTDKIRKIVENAYKHWDKQDWKQLAKVISYDDIETFQKDLMPFASALFGQNDYVVLYGDIYRREYFIDDEPHVSFALYMRVFSNKKSALKPMVTMKFIEVVKIIPRGLRHAVAKIRIQVDPGDGQREIVIDNNVTLTSSGWKINMPPPIANVVTMLGQTPAPR